MLHYDICRIDPWNSHKSFSIKVWKMFFSSTLASLILILSFR